MRSSTLIFITLILLHTLELWESKSKAKDIEFK